MIDKVETLITYAKTNETPLLVDFLFEEDLPEATVLKANISKTELVGHYEGVTYQPPKWLKQLNNNQNQKILLIDRIDSIPKAEQTKFIEILKYRQVSTFEIPKGTLIMVTVNKISKETINEEVYSLLAQI